MARSSTTAAEGNGLAVRHGARSEVIVAVNTPPVVTELVDTLREQVPYLTAPDVLIVQQLARIVVQLRQIDSYIDRLGGSLIDARGRPRGCWKLYVSLQHQFRETCKLLGLGPAERAKLIESMAGAGRDHVSSQAAVERLRRKAAEQRENRAITGQIAD